MTTKMLGKGNVINIWTPPITIALFGANYLIVSGNTCSSSVIACLTAAFHDSGCPDFLYTDTDRDKKK
jgi:hypothetical protein